MFPKTSQRVSHASSNGNTMAINDLETRYKSPSLSKWIAFLTSCAVHLTFCFLLACIYTLGGAGQSGRSILLALESSAESISLTNESFESVSLETETSLPEEPQTESSVPATLASFDVALDPATDSESDESLSEGLRSALTSLNDVESDITGEGAGNAVAKFYGQELVGNHFVFVIDSSSSMSGVRWESLKEELVRCVKGLSPDQRFFVIGFDSEPHPMFGLAPPRGAYVRPSKSSITKLQNWLNGIRLGGNTFPATSLMLAISMQPDAIMLLSDGEIADDSIVRLRVLNRKKLNDDEYKVKIPIHTYLLHSSIGYQALETIAEENDGVFTPINLMQQGRRRR
ncbi:MAG: vWA domain-containing protein [Pirellula sp.]